MVGYQRRRSNFRRSVSITKDFKDKVYLHGSHVDNFMMTDDFGIIKLLETIGYMFRKKKMHDLKISVELWHGKLASSS